jgi:hypothetical protein
MMIVALLALGCIQPEEEINLKGQVLTGRDTTVGASDVAVTIRDGRTKTFSSGSTDEDGIFRVRAPASSAVHIVLDGGAYVPTSFSTIVGSEDIEIPVGQLWMRTPSDIDDLRATFENCPTVDASGAIVEGEVNYKLTNQQTDERLIAEDARVSVFQDEGTGYTVCYLDDNGASSTEVEQVGATGRFAAFGINQGPAQIEFEVPLDGLTIDNYAFVWLPEDGVGPFYPALIDLN